MNSWPARRFGNGNATIVKRGRSQYSWGLEKLQNPHTLAVDSLTCFFTVAFASRTYLGKIHH